MKLIQDHPEWDWRTDDDAKMYFKHSADNPPASITCTRIGYIGLVLPPTVDADIETLTLLGVGEFGEPRPSGGTTKWTGDCYKYAVYLCQREFARTAIVILRSDGAGDYAYIDESTPAVPMWQHLCSTLSRERLWDLCQCITHTQQNAYKAGSDDLAEKFLEGKLKKRRRNGRAILSIVA